MAKITLVHANREIGHKSIGIAVLSAACKSGGHVFTLVDTAKYSLKIETSLAIGEELMEYKKVANQEALPLRIEVSEDELYQRVLKEVIDSKPDIIGFTTLSDDYPLAVKIASLCKRELGKPVIIGGVHATVDHDEVVRNNSFDVVCRGEGEQSLVEMLDAFDLHGNIFAITEIKNLTFKKDGRIIKNPLRNLRDLDSLPFLDWSVFDKIQSYKPYMGQVYRYGDYEIGRGCPCRCNYCVAGYYNKLYKSGGGFYRRKSNRRAIEELKYLKGAYDLEFIKFWDETFLLGGLKEFKEFASLYAANIGLPFVIETTAESVTPEKARILKEIGCASVSIGLETANYNLRKDVLGKLTKDETYEKAFELLLQNGIRTVSFIMIGLPFENREILKENIAFIQANKIDTPAVGYIYPYKGTAFREYCVKNSLIDLNEVREWENRVQKLNSTSYRSFIKNDAGYKIYLEHFKKHFVCYKELPLWLHPIIDALSKDEINKQDLQSILSSLVYQRRFPGVSPLGK